MLGAGVAAPPTFDGVGVLVLVAVGTGAVGVKVLVAVDVAVGVFVRVVVTGVQTTLNDPALLRFSVIAPPAALMVAVPAVILAVPLAMGVGRLKESI